MKNNILKEIGFSDEFISSLNQFEKENVVVNNLKTYKNEINFNNSYDSQDIIVNQSTNNTFSNFIIVNE